MKSVRDTSIECYRVALMFGICWLHAETQGDFNHAWLGNILACAVPGFVFISGYFGATFSIKRVLRLYGQALYGAVAYLLFQQFMTGSCVTVSEIWKVLCWSWFLHAYVFMMCVVPLFERALQGENSFASLRSVFPFVFLAFGWSYAIKVPVVGRFVPTTPGLGAYTGLTLCGVYLMACLYRKFDVGRFLNWHRACFLCLFAALLISVGFGGYHSIVSCLLAAALFWVFQHIRIPGVVRSLCAILSPSMFVIYIVHGHGMAWGYFKAIEKYFVEACGMHWSIAQIATATIVFAVCLFLDLPRRCSVLVVGWCMRQRRLKDA